MTAKLWNRDFTLLIVNQIMSIFANAIISFALPLYILEISGSAALFGTVLALSFVPLIITSPIGGMIADRVRRQRLMFWLDVAAAAVIVIYIAASGFTEYIIPIIIVKLMAINAIQGMYMPAVQSSIPVLVPTDKIVPANAAVQVINSLSGMLGPAVGGALYGTVGLYPILVSACICFAATAVLDLFMRIPYQKPETSGSVFKIVKSDMAESIRFAMKEQPAVAAITMVVLVFNITSTSMIIVGLPVIIVQTLNMGGVHYGISQGIFGAGGIIGGVLAGVIGSKLTIRHSHWLLLLMSVFSAPMGLALLLGAPHFVTYVIITASSLLMMLVITVFSIQALSTIQIITPPAICGKVVSCVVAITLCAHPAGQLLFGVLFENLAAWIVVIASALASSAVSLYSGRYFKRIEVSGNESPAEQKALKTTH